MPFGKYRSKDYNINMGSNYVGPHLMDGIGSRIRILATKLIYITVLKRGLNNVPFRTHTYKSKKSNIENFFQNIFCVLFCLQ